MKKKIIFLGASLLLLFSGMSAQTPADSVQQRHYFDISKNIEIYNSVLRELDMFYVDTLNIDKLVKGSIDQMLGSLDPYTNYFNKDDTKEFNTQITGEYAGVGATVAFKDGKVVIAEPFEGKPAAKAGLKAGDAILSIDGKDMTKCPKVAGEVYGRTLSSYVSTHLKGQPLSTAKVTVQRPGKKKPITLKVVREKIVLDPIPYYGKVSANTGYICLTSFTDKSAASVKNAFLDLKKQGISSLIIDLRQNGGGVLEQAIQIVNMFVPKGKVVLSTKGKIKQSFRSYLTTLDPIDTQIPLVVLIDSGSASASEIVSGSLQDMDRAVLIGQRSFGKGLVQSTRELPYDGEIKVTTAKYYIPSGRCIQAIDYSHRRPDGSVGRIPDSLTTVFHTSVGRPVRDGGGITPDLKVKEDTVPSITYYLSSQFIVFDWVTQWALNHASISNPAKFSITDKDYQDFKAFVKSKNFKYDRMSQKDMASLKKVMEFEGYMKTAGPEFKALEAKLVPNLDNDLDNFKKDIMQQINTEIVKRYYYQKGSYQFMLPNDKAVAKALSVFADPATYKKILSAPDPAKKGDDKKADKAQ